MPKLPVLLLALALPATAQPADLLRPVALVAGRPDTVLVADLFVDAADLSFHSPTGVEVAHDSVAGTLVLRPRAEADGLVLIPFVQRGAEGVLPARIRTLTPTTFAYPDPATDVFVIGSFNDWSRSRDRLTRTGSGFETTLDLEPGRYAYKFTADGEEVLDPANPETMPNGLGGTNNVLVVPPRHAQSAALVTLPSDGEALRFAYLRDGAPAEVKPEDVLALVGNRRLPPEAVTVEGGEVRVRRATAGEVVRVAVTQPPATRFATVLPGDGFAWQDAILYQIMVDRFADGDAGNSRSVRHDSVAARAGYHGGDLRGVLDKIEEGYFDSLGVSVLWLSPVVENTDRAEREYPSPHRWYTAYHGYWPTEPRAVESRFGDLALLQRLVAAAHARGLRVLLDFVANHVHEEHPYVREHRDWFGELDLPDGRKNLRLWDEHRLTTWFEPYLPSFDFQASDAALDAVTDDAVWWLDATGADGFRHDAVKHVPNRFWRTLTRKLRAAMPGDLRPYQIGETFGSYDLIASYVTPGQLDAQFNFNLYDTAMAVFLDPAAGFGALDAEMQKTLDVYGPAHLMGNLLDSHDKPRFLAYADGDLDGADEKEIGWTTDLRVDDPASYRLAELALAYLLTTPGVPTIYYGDEIGMTGAGDPDNRRPMRFGGEVTTRERVMKDRVAALVRLRREHAPLRRGGFLTLLADGPVWAYLRDAPEGSVLVVLNKGDEAQTLTLDLPVAFETARDALGGGTVAREGPQLSLTVSAVGYRAVALR